MRTQLRSGIRLAALSLVLFATSQLYAQTQDNANQGTCTTPDPNAAHFGMLASLSVNCSGFGAQVSPQLAIRKKNFLFSAGPSIQLHSGRLTGMKINLQYELRGLNADPDYEPAARLFVFVNSSYYSNATLGPSAQRVEHLAKPDSPVDYSHLSLRAFDIFAGLGVNWHINDHLMWMNSIGAGGSRTLSSPVMLYRDSQNFGIMLRTAICYTF